MKHYDYSIQTLLYIELYWYAAAIVLVLERQAGLIHFSQELVVYKYPYWQLLLTYTEVNTDLYAYTDFI